MDEEKSEFSGNDSLEQKNIQENAEMQKDFSNDVKSSEKEERKMYPAKCSECGKDCEVPFEPAEGKKVRCLDCFKKSRGNRFKKKLYDATCSKCNKRCKVPFRPSGTKPIYCRDCFKKE
jgi:CxxC-x17-CxxC domain-containing protein